VLIARELATVDQITAAKESLVRVVEMLAGLLRKFSSRSELLREDEALYGPLIEHEHDYEQEHEI
jgi:hypothetical protein